MNTADIYFNDILTIRRFCLLFQVLIVWGLLVLCFYFITETSGMLWMYFNEGEILQDSQWFTYFTYCYFKYKYTLSE